MVARFGRADMTRISDVVYGHKAGVALVMDVFKPEKPNGIAFIWIVSGGWVSDTRSMNPGLAKAFCDHGYTVFEVCHGSQPYFKLPDILKDVYRSVRFIRAGAAGFGIDPNKLAVSGGSAGGHLSLMIAAHGDDGDPNATDPIERASSKVQAVAAFYPPTDMGSWGAAGKIAVDQPILRVFWPAFGITDKTPRTEIEAMIPALSPLPAFTAAMPPTLFIHGDADALVPLQQSQIGYAKLQELKVPTQLIVRPGKGHGWGDVGPDIAAIIAWVDKYLGAVKN